MKHNTETEKQLGDYYWAQAEMINKLTVKYYEACDDDRGTPINPDETGDNVFSNNRAAACDNLFNYILDVYEECLGCKVKVDIIPNEDEG